MRLNTEPPFLELTLPADPDAIARARHAVDRLEPLIAPERLDEVRLLVSELVTNAIRHGPAGKHAEVVLRAVLEGDTLRVEVRDRGDGFRPHPREEGAIGGWGLLMVDQVASRWGVDEDGPTRVWFELEGARRAGQEPLERVREALQDSEERLRFALEAASMGTWTWDVGSGAVIWSESLERIHGLEPGSFGGSFEDFQRDVHPEDRARVLEAIERAVNSDAPYELDYRIVRPDGAVRWLTVRGTVGRDDAGKPTRMAGVCTDITARKEEERALEVQFTVARVLAESSSVEEATGRLLQEIAQGLNWEVGMLWWRDQASDVLRLAGGWHESGSERRFVAESKAHTFARGVGFPGHVWETRSASWIPDVAVDPYFPRAPLALADGLHAALALPVTLDGEVLGVIEFLSHRIREPDAELMRLMDAVGSQIGQFVERKAVEAQVAEREARMRAMFDSALEAIVTMGEDGTIVGMNPAATEMFGYPVEDAVGRELAELFIPEELRAQHRDAVERIRRTGHGRVLGRRLELEGLRADGSRFPVELTITEVAVPDGRLFTGYLRDISARRRIEELRGRLLESERISRERLEIANERMTFLADASMLLTSSLDVRKTLGKVARLAVPRLADWCSVEIVEPDGSIASLALAHVDPKKAQVARRFRERFPPQPDDPQGVAAVIRSGTSELYPEISEEMLRAAGLGDERIDFVRELGLRSVMTVPLRARGRVLGAITFASSESGRAFGEDDLALAEDLAVRAAVSIDNARLYEERSHVARTLQRTLLPRSLPEIPGLELASFYQSAGAMQTEVGGDFYDVFPAAEYGWGVVIGDVCGKGVEAAALTGLTRHTLRATALREPSPTRVLSDLNDVLLREDGDRYVSAALGRVKVADDGARVTMASAGHPLPIVLRAGGTVERLGVPGSLVGLFEDVTIEDRSTELGPGDALVLYTDGVVDPRRRFAMDEEDLEALLETCTGFTAVEICDLLGDAVADARGEAPDDTALLVLRVAT